MNFVSIITYILNRLQEPSTFAGIAFIAGFLHITLPAWVAPELSAFVAFLSASLAIFVPEKKS